MSLNPYKLIRLDGVNTKQGFVLVIEGSPEHEAFLAELGQQPEAADEDVAETPAVQKPVAVKKPIPKKR